MDKSEKIKKLKEELTVVLNFFREVEPYINPKTVGEMPACAPKFYGNAKLPIEEMCDKYPIFKKEFKDGESEIEGLIALYGFSEYTIYDFLGDNENDIESVLFQNIKDRCLSYYDNLRNILGNVKSEFKRGIEEEIFMLG